MQPVLLMSPMDCPCCAVLDRWRAYAGKLFALHDLARGREVFGLSYDYGSSGYRMQLSLEPRECARALLTSFTWFAVGLERLLQALTVDQHSWYEDSRAIAASLRQRAALELDIYRWDIRAHGYVFERDEEPVWITYSVDCAAAALTASFVKWRAGPLWPAVSAMSATQPAPGNPDRWYLQKALHLNSRCGDRLWYCATHETQL
jgi:hypothetical protein